MPAAAALAPIAAFASVESEFFSWGGKGVCGLIVCVLDIGVVDVAVGDDEEVDVVIKRLLLVVVVTKSVCCQRIETPNAFT
jgi:hypothetical protein